MTLIGSSDNGRIYFFCRKTRKWQKGKCLHWRCKRAAWFPKFRSQAEWYNSAAWGYKVSISVYFEGDPTEARLAAIIGAVNASSPDAVFGGVEFETVQDEPRDQVAS